MQSSRRRFMKSGTLNLASAAAGVWGTSSLARTIIAQELPSEPAVATETWHDVQDWGAEGKAWDDTVKYFDRFPARAKSTLRSAVWNLSRHSAGMLVRFETDATEIHVDYKVTSSNLAMPHMPATGVSGIDLYGTDDSGHLRWLAVSRPTSQETKTALINGLDGKKRIYGAYLPLYNGTEYLKIGVPSDAEFKPIAPRSSKPLVFYGTSITHGACASRPGMPHPAILGRRLDMPVVNLGFSGNGKMESAVGALLTEIDAAIYIIDCLPNMVSSEVAQRTIPLVNQLRAARPDTPILLVEDRTYANTGFLASRQQRHATSRRELKKAYQTLLDAGVTRLGYLDGEELLGNDRDDTTDGSHPSDLGFYRQANALEPAIRELLN